MDFLLTEKGDLLLEQTQTKDNAVAFNFFVKPNSSSICLKFDIEKKFIPTQNNGLLISFDIKNYKTTYQANTVDDLKMIKQMCYNAIRTQKDSLIHDKKYGSYFYKYKNKKISPDFLKELEVIAKEAISDFAPEANIIATSLPTSTGAAIIQFEIEIYRHTFNLDYFF